MNRCGGNGSVEGDGIDVVGRGKCGEDGVNVAGGVIVVARGRKRRKAWMWWEGRMGLTWEKRYEEDRIGLM